MHLWQERFSTVWNPQFPLPGKILGCKEPFISPNKERSSGYILCIYLCTCISQRKIIFLEAATETEKGNIECQAKSLLFETREENTVKIGHAETLFLPLLMGTHVLGMPYLHGLLYGS